MRSGMVVMAGALVLAGVAAAALAAQSDSKKVQVAPGAVADTAKLVRPQGFAQTVPTTPPGSALTADECKDMGGEVKYDQAGICARPFYCSVKDNFGIERAVCLEASK